MKLEIAFSYPLELYLPILLLNLEISYILTNLCKNINGLPLRM